MKVLRLLWAALREIFDEAAYDRYLVSHELKSSSANYRAFLQERRAMVERKPRCC